MLAGMPIRMVTAPDVTKQQQQGKKRKKISRETDAVKGFFRIDGERNRWKELILL